MLRRVHARTTKDIRLDNERPEYHRVTLEWSECAPPPLSPRKQLGGHAFARLVDLLATSTCHCPVSAGSDLPSVAAALEATDHEWVHISGDIS